MKLTVSCYLPGALLLGATARADFAPIPLTSDSFNQDVVVEKTAPPPLFPVTTGSMDAGSANTGFGWYERGYNADWPATGLPVAGSVITSEVAIDHDYRFAASYRSNNAVLIDSTFTSASLTLTTPTAYGRLSFLVGAGNGSGPLQVTVRHLDATTETGIVTCPDWFLTLNAAVTTYGRVDVATFNFDGVNNNHPGLFSRDFTLSNTNSPVTRVDFGYAGGNSHIAIFAVSGAATSIDPFVPFAVTGYNADLVVEASAARRGSLSGVTTATMDHGTANTSHTWYEQGYYPPAPSTGLPAAGSIITSATAPDHRYFLPSSYTVNNAVVIDATLDNASLTPATPAGYSVLSFLAAAGHGPVTNGCVTSHADGTSETNLLIIPDWLDTAPAAFIANGRLNIDNRIVDAVGGGNPRLFATDLSLANVISPVTNVLLTFQGGDLDSHAVILAVSGLPIAGGGTRAVLTIFAGPGGSFTIRTTQPGVLQSTTALKGAGTVWQDEGPIATTVLISPGPAAPMKFYRVVGH